MPNIFHSFTSVFSVTPILLQARSRCCGLMKAKVVYVLL